MASRMNGAGPAELLAGRARRARRTRENVDSCIQTAARQLFADRGYAATTTREIAQVADVSETLLFRYYGDKAQLFDAVIATPMNRVIQEFTAAQKAIGEPEAPNLYLLVYDLLTENRDLLSALVVGRPPADAMSGGERPSFEPFFEEAVKQLEAEYRAMGRMPDFDIDAGIRLAFGMMASAVLMRDWLFPKGGGGRDHVIEVLQAMVSRALGTASEGRPPIDGPHVRTL